MGKSLNGKGKGISQRKEDGLYIARFTNRFDSLFKGLEQFEQARKIG